MRSLLISLVFFHSFAFLSNAQKDSLSSHQSDSLNASQQLLNIVKSKAKEAAQQSIDKFKDGRTAIRQQQLLREIDRVVQKAKDYLKRGIDTSGTRSELSEIDRLFAIAGDGIFTKRGVIQSQRDLTTSYHLFSILLHKVQARKNIIDKYQSDLSYFRDRIDSLASDSSLYIFPSDSLSFWTYFTKLSVVSNQVSPTDDLITEAKSKVSSLDEQLNLQVNRITSRIEEIDSYQQQLSGESLSNEISELSNSKHSSSLSTVFRSSIEKGKFVFKYYLIENAWKIIIMISLIFLVFFCFRFLKKSWYQDGQLSNEQVNFHVFEHPFLVSGFLVINLYQFFFNDPPFIFSFLIWMLAFVILGFIFKNVILSYWLRIWMLLLTLFTLACADNLILQFSAYERWIIFVLSFIGFAGGVLILLKGHKEELMERRIIYFIVFGIILEFASLIANIFGAYNISKSLMVGGYVNVVTALLLLWAARFISEILTVCTRIYSGAEKKPTTIDFTRISSSAPSIIYILLAIGWVILLGRNFYSFKLITQPVSDFLFNERTIGAYNFTVSNILVFFVIMVISVILSRIVSFFASDNSSILIPGKERKPGMGSWILLVRIFIICLGLFFAFAATGIPMERITIILGALGVGIGLGLQSLVNNLVSGLIIAFEKPFNVGDVVDVAGISGKVKSIGFRSSVVSTWDGADVFIPNGDLLSSHLINWTISSRTRRTSLSVGVGYGTDLEKVKKIIFELIASDKRIRNSPEPAVTFQEFGDSAIVVKIFYWINGFRDLSSTRSDLVAAIHKSFAENRIEIPFPQQEIHIRTQENKKDKEF